MANHSRSLSRLVIVGATCLCLLVAAMIFVIWRDGQALRKMPLTGVAASTIRIQRDGFDDILLSNTGQQWQIEFPCKLKANEQRLSPLLSALTPAAHQYAASDVDLEAAGLLTPQAIVHINEVEHRLGNTDLNGERRYVQRNNMVQFAPEWVLSLVNGGLTALAQPDVFTDPLNHLTIIYENGSEIDITTADELLLWQNLAARQIASWPLPDVELSATYQVNTTGTDGNRQSFQVYMSDSLIAIRLDDAQCAHILSADALPHYETIRE